MCQSVADNPAWSWTSHVDLAEDRGELLRLRLKPGQGRLIRFITGQRQKLSQEIARVSGRTVRIDIEEPDPNDVGQSQSARPRRAITQEDKDQAMRLPLVRKLTDVFDAQLIDVQEEHQPPPPAPEDDV